MPWKPAPALLLSLMTLPVLLPGQDPLSVLDDEFDDPATMSDWQRITFVEQWGNEPLETLDIDTTRSGWLTMMPRTTSWYEDYRGPLFFKEVSGDFVVTSSVEATGRNGIGAPNRQYSLAGIMIRSPRNVTPQTWTPGGEKYTFLSIGSASNPGTFQFEVKTTSNEDEYPQYSYLEISNTDCGCGEALIQSARIGTVMIQMSKTPTGPWRVINRYRRPDLPETVQVGFVAYTDWETVQGYPVDVHNVTTITHQYNQPDAPAIPDLIGSFDYARFVTPHVPPEFQGLDLADPNAISDEELLSFLGENAGQGGVSEVWSLY